MDDCAPGDGHAFVDGLGAYDAGGADFVGKLAGLVEDEGEEVLVICYCDRALDYELAVSDNGCAVGAVVGVFPENTGVLFVDAHYVRPGVWVTVVVGDDCAHVMDCA